MTAQEELTLLEEAYEALLTGGVQSYSINGRSLTRLNLTEITRRIDVLRAQVARAGTGLMRAARNRRPE